MVTFNDSDRQDEIYALGLHMHDQPRESQASQAGCDWKLDHLNICKANNVMWPINFNETAANDVTISLAGLLPRECEVAWMANRFWKPTSSDGVEFFDINPQTNWVFKSYMTLDMVLTEELLEDFPRGPWRTSPPTMAGSTKIFMRYSTSNGFQCRCWEGVEYFRALGWHDDAWRLPTADALNCVTGSELLANLAGNAFSLYHYGPFVISTLATFGRFSPDPSQALSQEHCDGKDSEDDTGGDEPASSAESFSSD